MMAILRRALWLVLIVAAVGAVTWRPQAIAEAQAQSGAAVRTAPAGHRVGATPGKKGATDYWLESQTTRLTAKYSDGTTAVAGRGTDGNFETKLSDRSGGEVGRFTVNRAAARWRRRHRAALRGTIGRGIVCLRRSKRPPHARLGQYAGLLAIQGWRAGRGVRLRVAKRPDAAAGRRCARRRAAVYGCSSRSWWQYWSSWTCDLCNAGAVFCFAGGGNGKGPFHPFPF